MMDIDNLLIFKDLGCIVVNCFVISGVLLLGILPIIENSFQNNDSIRARRTCGP